jgi:peptidoglycan/xylan/chitin deacetylase (PgdA/CDA1 family)
MRLYTFPKWLKWMYPGAIWEFSHHKKKTIYLTFDDGPNEDITHYILNLLAKYDAKGTFFCLGENVKMYPDLYKVITQKGHTIGNHSMTHPNGWWTANKKYLADVDAATEFIDSKLFRPPYGKVSIPQYKALRKMGYHVIFWSVVSYDFDPALRKKDLIKKMKKLTHPGAVFVFHDNPKAVPVLKNELPKLMEFWKDEGYIFECIPPK